MMLHTKSIPKNRFISLITRNNTTRSTSGDGYQYLQKSKIPMLHFQPSLLRLPIPALEKTCERYLAAQRPLLIDEAYRKTKDNVDRFHSTSGQRLQELLKEKDANNKHTSYISEPWFDMYLRDRAPLPVNYNPLMMMNPDPRPAYNDQLIRTANLVVSSLRFYKSLRAKCLEPEVFHLNPQKSKTDTFELLTSLSPSFISTYVAYAFKAYPLDMSQYQGLFGGTRIPETDKDRIYRNEKAKHLIVLRKGHFYSVDVLDDSGNIMQPSTILARFKYVLSDNRPPVEHPVGLLTSENRNVWASLRHHLAEIGNEKALKTIDSALFCVCLDETTIDPANPIPMVKDFLYGNSGNRWFDKSVSLLVAKDGSAGINFEHSWGDGVAVLRYFNDIYKETIQEPFVHPETRAVDGKDVELSVKMIDFTLNDKIKQGILNAENNHNSVIDSLEMNFLKYEGINKEMCKKHRISPDCVMQLGFQLALYKQLAKFVATYESCSTAAFRHGRTETMRPCTVATKEFCEAISKRNPPSTNELRAMMNNCSAIHGQLTKDAAMGQGFDRHLFGLKHMAEINDIKKPAIFEDPAYSNINHNVLSTSTLSSPALLAGGFGPVVKDGYGIGYNIQEQFCGGVISNYKNERDGKEFVNCLKSAFSDIATVLNSSSRSQS